MKKLPDDSFAYYLALGMERSYQAVADHFGVDKKTVTNRAVKESWKEKLADHEREQRKAQEKKAAESLEAMNDRHLKVIGYIQAKGIEALKAMPIDSAIDAVRAIAIAIEKERLIRGEPSERTVVDIEKRIRDEHDRWLVPVDPEPEPPPTPEPTQGADPQRGREPMSQQEPEHPNDAGSQDQAPGAAA